MGRYFLLFCFISTTVFAQDKNLDSFRVVLKTAKGKDKALALLELGWGYRFINADTARKFAFEALSLSRQEGIEDYEAEALNTIGVTHEAQGNYDEALSYELKALELRRKIGDSIKIAGSLNAIGIVHDEKGEYDKALAYYYDARKIYESLKAESQIAMVLTNIGIVLRVQKQYKDVVTYYRQAMTIYQKLGNKFGMAACHANLGSVYVNIPNYDSAIYYSLLASKEFEAQNIRQFLPAAWTNAAAAYDKLGKLDKAREYFLKAKELHAEYDNKKELSFTLSQLARIESKMGNTVAAEQFAKDALKMATAIKAMEQVMQAHEALAETSARANNFKSAYQEQILFGQAKDSLFHKEKAKALLELQTKYDTEKNKQQIALLNQENELKTATIERNTILIAGLSLIILLSIVVFYLWRKRQLHQQEVVMQEQKMRMREAQISAVIDSQEKERSRFASDLHDGIGQLVSALQITVQSIRKNQDGFDKRDELFSNSEQLLTEIHQEIRNVAFNLMPPVLVKEGLLPAVSELLRKVNKAGKIKCAVKAFDFDGRFAELAEISLYRIVQEFISNIIKYSSASQVTISFTGFEEEVVLTIEDDGVGYDLDKFKVSEGNGWRNIHSRLNLIKASVDFDVVDGRKNNTVTITIPATSLTEQKLTVQNTNLSV